jgi:hypothetical protein
LNSGEGKANAWTRSAEGAELHEAVYSVLAHELGGIAGALDLRAAALARTIPPNDVAALRGLAEEVRASTRTVRLLRGADAYGTLTPNRQQSLSDWWRLASRLTRVVLPNGTTLNATFDESRLNPAHVAPLTWIWLSACKGLAELASEPGLPVTLRGDSEGGSIHLKAETVGSAVPGPDSRWSEHSATVASTIGVAAARWERADGVISWSFSLPVAAN